MKTLTIIVPAYNVEDYLQKCLDSFLLPEVFEKLEVIIVDDGSTDASADIARRYVKQAPDVFSLVQKENGGHGSVINTGVQLATGRYFKVVDADDWVVNLKEFLDFLDASTAQAVISGHQTHNMASGRVMDYPSTCQYLSQEITMSQLMEAYDDIADCCSFHGLCFETSAYLEHQIQLTEHVFFDDQEYAVMPFSYVERIAIAPVIFYQYLIGNANQSVAIPNQVKRIGHIETTVRNLVNYRNSMDLSADADAYFLRKLTIVAISYLATALVKNPDKKGGRQLAVAFECWLSGAYPQLLQNMQKKRKTLWLLHYLRLSPKLYQLALDTSFYRHIRRIWTR